MATAIQRRRGTTEEHATFAGLAGEVTVDTTKKTLVVHDGETVGGYPLATEQFVTQAMSDNELASEAAAGRLRLATQAQAEAGDEGGAYAMTPLLVKRQITGRANLNLDNLTPTGRKEISSCGMPGNTRINLTLQGSQPLTDFFWENIHGDGFVTVCFRCNVSTAWSCFVSTRKNRHGIDKNATGGIGPANVYGGDWWETIHIAADDFLVYNFNGCYPYVAYFTYSKGWI